MAHYYLTDGTPYYQVVGANGKLRDTTLKDVKKAGALYSTTGIIQIVDKPALTQWKITQALLAVIEEPEFLPDESFDSYKKRVLTTYNENISVFSKRGTEVHDALERFYKTGLVEPENEDLLYPAIAKVDTLGYNIAEAERSFGGEGYGGKIDLILDNGEAILDFKTKQGNQEYLDKVTLYNDYCMQLAAYRKAINPKAKCYNLLISTTHPGALRLIEWPEEDLEKGWKMFKCLLDFTCLINNYDPRVINE